MNQKIELGDTIKHKVSGFTGVVTGYVTYLLSPDRVQVTPKANANNEARIEWLDLTECEVIEKSTVKKD